MIRSLLATTDDRAALVARLTLGLVGRAAALGIVGVMIGAAVLVHLPNGFFMNWSGTAAGEGFEYHLLAIALGLVVVIRGSGAFSLDLALMRRAFPRFQRHPALSNA